MAESSRLTDLVQDALDAFLDRQAEHAAAVSPDLAPFVDEARGLLARGKRFRARFCYWGWRAVAGIPDELDPMSPSAPDGDADAVVGVAAALELLHAAALVHDDIIDRSATRRGRASAHETFATMHRDAGWTRDPARFGDAAALLLGDLLLGWADSALRVATGLLADRSAATAAVAEFERMRAEVTFGQLLDVLEEHSWIARPDADAARRAQRVVVYKSAKYSVEAPLVIGALLGGATGGQVTALRGFGVPLGIAFQLRDDLLGVYGDPETTGKPAGDDLREGKRTVLVALARSVLPGSARSLLDELLGDPELDEAQIDLIRRTLRECGAVEQVERAIDYNLGQATAAIEGARITSSARAELLALAEAVARREA
ncbi:MAG: geranylgeranyl pyrophosphate synthase [Micrococcales bacterium 73-13]|nr:MAG: geranylgeranyl pyrophosphate synthase [Micrococcales bacterium 73-13]